MLVTRIYEMAQKMGLQKQVEIIWLVDNWMRTLGSKRQNMVEMAQGEYIVFCDDDDNLADDFLKEIVPAMDQKPDVITFWEDCTWNEYRGVLKYGLKNPYELMQLRGTCLRPAIHVSVWKRELCLKIKFKDTNWGEDKAWGELACPLAEKEVHIPKVLRIYNHQDARSEAFAAHTGQR
jgi:glycosyltransferase involved in cell wall biosynthesis